MKSKGGEIDYLGRTREVEWLLHKLLQLLLLLLLLLLPLLLLLLLQGCKHELNSSAGTQEQGRGVNKELGILYVWVTNKACFIDIIMNELSCNHVENASKFT